MKQAIIAATVFCATAFTAARADVVGWWRFNGEGTYVPNVANPGTLDGTIVSVSNDVSNAIASPEVVSFGNDSTKCPTVTSDLQGDAPRVYDPLDGKVYDGGKTLSYDKPFIQGGVMIPYSDALDLTTFTIQAMIRLPKNASSRGGYGSGMFPIAQFGKDQTEGWMFSVYNGYLFSRFTYTNTEGAVTNLGIKAYYYTNSGFPSLYDGKWHHVAMAFNTAGVYAVCRMFVDGVQCAENRATDWKEWNFSGRRPLFIGANPYHYARTFYGDIAEVRITNDATSKDHGNNFLVPLVDGQGLADNDTALLLTFDNAVKFGFPSNQVIATKETAGTSDTHANKAYTWYAKNWNILNSAYNMPTIPHWLAYATKGEAEHLTPELWPTNSAETAGALVSYASAGTTNVMADTWSLDLPSYARTSGTTIRSVSNVIQLDDGACYFSTNSFTAECFFKTSIGDGVTDTIFYAPYLKLCVYQGKLLLRGYSNGNESGIGGDIKGVKAVNDGEWHHVACVYNATTKTLTLWQDGADVGSKSGTALYSGGYQTKTGLTTLGFLIGGQRFAIDGDVQGFKGGLDAVRITRRVLTADEFLTSADMPELIFDARFDDDTPPEFSSGVPSHILGDGVGHARTGGTSPSTVASRGGWVVFDGDGGSEKSGFGKALNLDGGYVLYPRSRLLERQDFTVEFFAKLSDIQNNSRIVALNWGDGVGRPVWTLYKSVGSKGEERLTFSSYTTSDGGVTTDGQKFQHLYRLADDDKRWHHWAMTVAPTENGRIGVSLYRDHVLVQSDMPWSVTDNNVVYHGQMYIPPQGTSFSIGGSAYTGMTIDNVRITPGVLDPSGFMGFEAAGMMVILK